MLLLAAACRQGGQTPAAGIGHVTLVRLGKDTVRFSVPAVTRRCSGGRGWLITAQEGGNGTLIWFRPAAAADSTGVLKGRYGLRSRDDTTPGRAAFAAIRYMVGETPHGLNIDAGSADLDDTTGRFSARLDGLGLEAVQAQQISVVARFESLSVADSTPCAHP